MFRKALLVVAVLLLTGCGMLDRGCAKYTGQPSKVCVDGVLYLQFTSGATVAMGIDGKIKLCGR